MGLTRPRAYQIYDIDYKQSVRVITLTNITLSGGAPSQVDGVNLSVNDRILVAGQTTGSQNGIYIVSVLGTGANGTWIRSVDTNTTGELESGTIVMVTEGTTYADTSWKLTTNDPITIGTTALTFEINTGNAFGTISANGTSVVANSATGTVTFSTGNNIVITGNAATDTITFAVKDSPTFYGNVLPGANVTYDLGTTTSRWRDIWLANSTIYLGNAQISANATSVIITNPAGGTTVLSGATPSVNANTVVATGNITAGGNIQGGNIISNALVSAVTVSTTGNITATGNLSGGNILTTGAIFDTSGALQINTTTASNVSLAPNQSIVLVATTTGANVTGTFNATGNANVGNLGATNAVLAGTLTGVTTMGASGNISATGNVQGGNIISNALVSTTTVAASGNITATGNIQGGNVISNALVSAVTVTASGNITATGNVSGGNLLLTGGMFDSSGVLQLNTTTASNIALAPNQSVVLVATTTGANITGTLNATGNANVGNLGATNANLTAITATGNANVGNLGTAGLITATGNVTGGNLTTAGQVTASGNITGNYLLANITFASGYNTTRLFNGTSEANIGTSGGNANITIGGVSNVAVFSTAGANITGTLGVTGNITGGNVSGTLLTGTLTTAAQPNVTSVGTLTSLTATGNVTGGNLITTGTVSTETLTASGNVTVAGNLTVSGNVISVNVTNLNVVDPIIGIGRGANNTPLTSNDGKDRGEQLWYYTTNEQSAFIGYDNSAGKLIAATNVSVSSEVVTVNNYGNLVVGGLEATTISSTGNANVGNLGATTVVATTLTGTLSTASQPNVTSVGTLISLSVTGNITGGNLNTGAQVVATGNITGGNINTAGQVVATGNIHGALIKSSANIEIQNRGILFLNDSDNSNYVGLRSPAALTGNYIYIMPSSYGNADQVLSTNGSGGLAWVDQSGGGGGGSASQYPNSTVQPVPGSTGNFDLSYNFVQTVQEVPYETSATDPFGVNLGEVYSMMDPVGEVLEGVDLGVLT